MCIRDRITGEKLKKLKNERELIDSERKILLTNNPPEVGIQTNATDPAGLRIPHSQILAANDAPKNIDWPSSEFGNINARITQNELKSKLNQIELELEKLKAEQWLLVCPLIVALFSGLPAWIQLFRQPKTT